MTDTVSYPNNGNQFHNYWRQLQVRCTRIKDTLDLVDSRSEELYVKFADDLNIISKSQLVLDLLENLREINNGTTHFLVLCIRQFVHNVLETMCTVASSRTHERIGHSKIWRISKSQLSREDYGFLYVNICDQYSITPEQLDMVEELGDICGWNVNDDQPQTSKADILHSTNSDSDNMMNYIKKQTNSPKIFITWLCKVDVDAMAQDIKQWGNSPDDNSPRAALAQLLLDIINPYIIQYSK